MGQETKGTCFSCHESITEAEARAHLEGCKAIEGDSEGFLLKVSSEKDPSLYWMFLGISKGATLHTLDQFLRETWLECTGHLSMFTIEKLHFSSHARGDFDKSPIDTQVGELLSPGLSFTYLYDFDNSTHLKLEVVSEWGHCPQGQIALLIQNHPPAVDCRECGKGADLLCDVCFGSICSACQKGHACKEHILKPILNSPRRKITAAE